MASFEDSYKSQLQGVSQQIARERLDGQVTAQDNMLSDSVTNLRRRPGAAMVYSIEAPGETDLTVRAWDTDIKGQKVQVVLGTATGTVWLLREDYTLLRKCTPNPYLITSNINDIQVATVGDEFFLANVTKKPVRVPQGAGVINPNRQGMFYVRAGAFSKEYNLRVQTSAGAYTASFTTPNGATAGDAALATPEHIATQLVNALNAQTGTHNVTFYREGGFVYGRSASATPVSLTITSGSNYMVASGASYVRQEADLPVRLPTQADGYIVSTGDLRALRYYRYAASTNTWLETGDFASPQGLTNMPVSITEIGGVWDVREAAYEGRLAGDDNTNADPAFIDRGITGMSAYQGRLVILAGSVAVLSASNKPYRFWRSTVTTLTDDDRIEVGSAAASSAAYRYAVQFQKDLLLFSEKYQAVLPGGNVAITPRTASVLVTSTYDSDMTSSPIPVGRTLMYPAPRSQDFFGLLEMLPSQIADSQYTSYDSTAHLPKYMPGKCRAAVSSSVANMVLFSPTGDRNSLIVHEYTWQGDDKVQQAWHRWQFRYPVATMYFSEQTVHLLFVRNGMIVGCTVDPRLGNTTESAERRPFLDMYSFVDVVDHRVDYPAWIAAFAPDALEELRLSTAEGNLSGERVGFTVQDGYLQTLRDFPDGRVAIGFPYRSLWSPTPPMVKDQNGVKISSNKLTVLRFMIGTTGSAEYEVIVRDAQNTNGGAVDTGTLYWSSPELALEYARVAGDSTAIIPCRTAADSTVMLVYTEGLGELNVIALEYVARFNQKLKRAQREA